MRYQYVVILKRDSDRTIDMISILLCFFSALSFLFEQSHAQHPNFFLILAALLILAGTLLNIFLSGKKKRQAGTRPPQVRYKYLLLIAGIGWLAMTYLQWLSAFFFLLTFLEYQAKYPLEIGFSHDRVVINTLFKKRFDWSAFNNIILKDGLLTLDFKNNRLLQKEVIDDEEGEADEDEFNDYCQGRLKEV
jgi:drug/metabolite transporter (DMT)-like permease